MKTGRSLGALALLAAAAGACVPYPAELLPDEGRGNSQYALSEGAYPGLDAGASEKAGIHCKVKAYGAEFAVETLDLCEQTYGRILTDTGLISFTQRAPYELVLYGSQDEYRKKTGQADWSSGITVGNSIYAYVSPTLNGVLSHQMAHVIWLEFMNGRLGDQQRWVNEGFAVYEDATARTRGNELFGGLLSVLRSAPMPMDQLENMAPNTERAYETSLWYAQSESMIRFMIERGGRIGFGQFLGSIQQNQSFDSAISAGFPGKWQTLASFETDWKAGLQ